MSINIDPAIVAKLTELIDLFSDSIDSSTGAVNIVDYEHHEIHGGSHYFIEDVADIAISNVFDVQWTTPDTAKWEHFTFELNCESETEWYIYEGATINVSGSIMTPTNNNRNSVNVSSASIASILNTSVGNADSDTATASALEIAHGRIGAGRNGGVIVREREIVLKQNTVYCMRAVATAAGYVNFYMGWYEHTND